MATERFSNKEQAIARYRALVNRFNNIRIEKYKSKDGTSKWRLKY